MFAKQFFANLLRLKEIANEVACGQLWETDRALRVKRDPTSQQKVDLSFLGHRSGEKPELYLESHNRWSLQGKRENSFSG